ncbi:MULTISPECIES: DUF4250 domain-containing protein [unclassified Fusibacter]|uniref:DUF4250 domain-containing protein n=1 Tax=unclassified Fusibacter TaxID=2624464 RepID=UPI001011F0DF|nr:MULTISPECIES: DUF4250 domain-containing protein [unclassified Fusibacter]MCK8059322.1 DUF4250 domain-containing protein [Fusibacter sp. A2]NPE21214.1 DUF4250 domain-containing protein [Fusibacter sp. A1]RXV62482.1 DUF4250 domain-containing protein [Fusibacter sp. A1]
MFAPKLPNDPHLLLSMVNMKLRDEYDSLHALVDDFHIDSHDLINKLALHGYVYHEKNNQFVHQEVFQK